MTTDQGKDDTRNDLDQRIEQAKARAWSQFNVAMLTFDHAAEMAGPSDREAAEMVVIMRALEGGPELRKKVFPKAEWSLQQRTRADGRPLAVTGARQGEQATQALARRIHSMDVYALDARKLAKAALEIIDTTSIFHDLAPDAPRIGSGTYDQDYAVALDAIEARVTRRLAPIREPALAASCGVGVAENELRDKLSDLPRLVLTDALVAMGVDDTQARRFLPKPN